MRFIGNKNKFTELLSPKRQTWNLCFQVVLLVCLAICAALSSGCGPLEQAVTVRDYRVAVDSEDSQVRLKVGQLIRAFNRELGDPVLTYVSDPSQATSPIRLVSGLEDRSGKLGLGGQVYSTERRGLTLRRTVSFQIDLDKDYVLQRTPGKEGTIAHDDLRLLLFHEIGHGLGLGHSSNPVDVMYFDLNGAKDFPSFFSEVRRQLQGE